MASDQRRDEILASVDRLVDCHDRWSEDDQAPDVPTQEMERLMEAVIEVCDTGSVPEDCRSLVTSVGRLSVEWESYRNGNWDRAGRPYPSFWNSFRGMLNERATAVVVPQASPPSVQALIDEGVGYQQIAYAIYGSRSLGGPFIDENGHMSEVLIRKEAEEPGSVVPVGWIHPSIQQQQANREDRERTRIQAVADLENKDKPVPTVEEMLNDGAYIEQITKITKREEDQIRQMAEILGIPIKKYETPTGAVRAPAEPQISKADHAMMDSQLADPKPDADADPEVDETTEDIEPGDMSDDQISDEVVMQFTDGGTSTTIAKTMGITVQKAAQIIRRHKERIVSDV